MKQRRCVFDAPERLGAAVAGLVGENPARRVGRSERNAKTAERALFTALPFLSCNPLPSCNPVPSHRPAVVVAPGRPPGGT